MSKREVSKLLLNYTVEGLLEAIITDSISLEEYINYFTQKFPITLFYKEGMYRRLKGEEDFKDSCLPKNAKFYNQVCYSDTMYLLDHYGDPLDIIQHFPSILKQMDYCGEDEDELIRSFHRLNQTNIKHERNLYKRGLSYDSIYPIEPSIRLEEIAKNPSIRNCLHYNSLLINTTLEDLNLEDYFKDANFKNICKAVNDYTNIPEELQILNVKYGNKLLYYRAIEEPDIAIKVMEKAKADCKNVYKTI